MTTQPNLRCRNCWRPYAIHANDVCPPGGYTTYEPDDSPEARVYAVVEELIAVAFLYFDSKDDR